MKLKTILASTLFSLTLFASTGQANTLGNSTTPPPSVDNTGGALGGGILGLYYYNTANLVGRRQYGAWSGSMCTAAGGKYIMTMNSSRRRTGQGSDIQYMCLP